MQDLLAQLELAYEELDPQFKAIKGVMAALKTAVRLASDEKPDALPMYKALVKLESTAAEMDNATLNTAVSAFADVTQTALDNLAFEFAKDLRDAFMARGETVAGRPPTLSVGIFALNIDIAARKGQWFYGKEPLTKPIPLSTAGILKAYDQQEKRIGQRDLKVEEFVAELKQAWRDCLDKRTKQPSDGRINIVEAYSQLTLNRQGNRFWNQPSRKTFKDYERDLFVRDFVLVREQQAADKFRLGVATKSQADQANRSLWLPEGAIDGQYYGDITFSS